MVLGLWHGNFGQSRQSSRSKSRRKPASARAFLSRSNRKLWRDPVLGLYLAVLGLGLIGLAEHGARPGGITAAVRQALGLPIPVQMVSDKAGKTGASSGCLLGDVYDGDTLTLICDGNSRSARLLGFDTPELRGAKCDSERRAAEAARDALSAHIRRAQSLGIQREGLDKYQRELVRLWIDGRDLADIMVAEGHARAYDGGTRLGWCG